MVDSTEDTFLTLPGGHHKVPREVYVISVSSEWPIDVVSGHPASHAPDEVGRIVGRRMESGNVSQDGHQIKVFKARLADIEEVEFIPARKLPAELKTRGE